MGIVAALISPTVTATADASISATPDLTVAHFVVADFGTDSGWRGNMHPRFVVDITGDHRADIVAFGNAGVYTMTATGDGGFTNWRFAIADFGFDQAWRVVPDGVFVPTPRFVTDITADGRADIVGVGWAGIYTAVSNGDGTFDPMTLQSSSFTAFDCPEGSVQTADINGDRNSDLVCQSFGGLLAAIALGNGNFAAPILVSTEFSAETSATDVLNFADLNRDGRADLIDVRSGFGAPAVATLTAIARPDNTFPPTRQAGAIIPASGRSVVPSATTDINDDACADLIAFSTFLHWAMGDCDGTFQNYGTISSDFGFVSGWNANRHVRAMADITGDGRADVVGINDFGVNTANSVGNGLITPTRIGVVRDFGFNQGWRTLDNPRVFADITGDRRADIVGYGTAGVYTAVSSGDGSFF